MKPNLRIKHIEIEYEPKVLCEHHPYCLAEKFGHINCSSQSSIEICRSYKLYKDYGEDNNLQGIGAKI